MSIKRANEIWAAETRVALNCSAWNFLWKSSWIRDYPKPLVDANINCKCACFHLGNTEKWERRFVTVYPRKMRWKRPFSCPLLATIHCISLKDRIVLLKRAFSIFLGHWWIYTPFARIRAVFYLRQTLWFLILASNQRNKTYVSFTNYFRID